MITTTKGLTLYKTLYTARVVEATERKIIARGEAHFHVAGAGHEAVAGLADALIAEDWLHCHYRDRALMLARGLPAQAFFNEIYANALSTSGGRQLNTMLSDRALNIVSMPVSVANNLLPSVGIAHQIKNHPTRPLVYCSVGDGGTQQGEFFESIAEAVRSQLPVLFLIQNNNYALSTPTAGQTFFSLPDGRQATELFGLPLHRLDGRDPIDCQDKFATWVEHIRRTRGPVLAILDVERLASHSNADDQSLYRTAEEISRVAETADPVSVLRARLLSDGVDPAELEVLEQECAAHVQEAAEAARRAGPPVNGVPCREPLSQTYLARTEAATVQGDPVLTMREAMRDVLAAALERNESVTLYGEDIEDPKGDVFGVTEGLSTRFPGRVINSALAEATIMGVSIGRALAGGRPVAFVQFADFLPLIYNLFHSELASLYWRSQGQWSCPVIIIVSSGGYRAGTGPFHSQTLEAVLAHTPGVDVLMPSTAADAAGMLNAAFDSPRPTVLLYPKHLLNDRSRMTGSHVEQHWVPVGRAAIRREGSDVTLVGWGNTVPVCEQAAEQLASLGFSAEVIDLRSISPWDEEAVLRSATRTGRLVVVHEDNRTCGVGGEVCARVNELAEQPIATRRVCREDTFTPFHRELHLATLPTVRQVVDASVGLLGHTLTWVPEATGDEAIETVLAQPVGASDDSVTLVDWLVKAGDSVVVDQCLAVVESDKAAAEVLSAHNGIVEHLEVEVGTLVKVGAPLLRLRITPDGRQSGQTGPERAAKPVLDAPVIENRAPAIVHEEAHRVTDVCLTSIASALASDCIDNDHFLQRHPAKTRDEIVRHTGIESRRWAGPDQNLLSMAIEAARNALDQRGLSLRDVDLILCATTTPDLATPSLACRLMHALDTTVECPAYDFSAACSGYLYGLHNAWHFLQGKPNGRVLLVTAEVLSKLTNTDDYDTAILFGDGATATLLEGSPPEGRAALHLSQPVISAQGEAGDILRVPLLGSGECISMRGKVVFQQAVRKMAEMLQSACAAEQITVDDLTAIIPHQANERILNALQRRLRAPDGKVLGNIKAFGNTSSCSIPYCLQENWDRFAPDSRVALVSFGGGFTYGAAVMRLPKS
jgi:2-oxoisovalerate dehydrogenase E1 component